MYKKGQESGLFMFEIFKNVATQRLTPHLQKLLKEMNKKVPFSDKGDNRTEFIKNCRKKIQVLVSEFKPQELPLFS